MYSRGLSVGLAATWWSGGNGVLAWATVMVMLLTTVAVVSPDRRMEAGFTAAALVPQIVQQCLISAATLDNRVWHVAWTSLVGVVAYTIGTVAQVLLGGATAVNNLILWIGCTALAAGLLAGACHRRFSRRRPRVFRFFAVRSLRATAASATVLAIWRIDVLIVRTRPQGFRRTRPVRWWP